MTASSEPQENDAASLFAAHRHLLLGVAYRILGTIADAEEVTQETWLRLLQIDPSDLADPRAFLVTVTSRLAIDRLRRIRARRESYIGPWLPEPFVAEHDAEQDKAAVAEDVSMALLVVLETLTPLERAVFVLHEVFGYPYAVIAGILDRSEPAVRQHGHRARGRVAERRPRFTSDPATGRRAVEAFLAAAQGNDLPALMEILSPGVILIPDGGGLALAPRRPLEGSAEVARFLIAIAARPIPEPGIRLVNVNGGPGAVVTSGGRPVAAFAFDVDDGRIRTIYLVANPQKLAAIPR